MAIHRGHFAPAQSSLLGAKPLPAREDMLFQSLRMPQNVGSALALYFLSPTALPQERAMKTFRVTFPRTVPALALTAALSFSGQLMRAQSVSDGSQTTQPTEQQQGMQPDDQDTTQKTFTGVIVKSSGKLILTDTISKTSYQLDDQLKAQDFVNKNVKVTGGLDPSTGTIHVRVINPA